MGNNKTTKVRNMIVMAGGKKGASKRSRMLKMIMPMLSQENGDTLAEAIGNKDTTKFKVVWEKIKKELVDKIASQKTHANASSLSDDTLWADFLAMSDNLDDFGAELYKEFVVKAHDLSKMLMGSGNLQEKCREFMANGVVLFVTGETLSLTKIKVKENSAKQMNEGNNVEMDVEAEIHHVTTDTKIILKSRGTLYAATTDIIYKALAIL
jgi:hypothetical protein